MFRFVTVSVLLQPLPFFNQYSESSLFSFPIYNTFNYFFCRASSFFLWAILLIVFMNILVTFLKTVETVYGYIVTRQCFKIYLRFGALTNFLQFVVPRVSFCSVFALVYHSPSENHQIVTVWMYLPVISRREVTDFCRMCVFPCHITSGSYELLQNYSQLDKKQWHTKFSHINIGSS